MKKVTALNKIKKILQNIDDSIEDDAKVAMVKAFWEIGRLALEYKAQTGVLIKDIAKELDVHRAALQRYTQFNKTFPDGYPERLNDRVVTWSNIVMVLPIHNAKERLFYLEEATRLGWSKHELKAQIKENYYLQNETQKQSKRSKIIKIQEGRLYTYAAEVIKVIDADTFDVEIDVGFKTKQEHRLRLRGVNCPELKTKQGEKAKAFVEGELAKCIVEKPLFKGILAARPLVVVRTYKQGVFLRYIADVYYKPNEKNPEEILKNGHLLNQVLIDKGFAQKM